MLEVRGLWKNTRRMGTKGINMEVEGNPWACKEAGQEEHLANVS